MEHGQVQLAQREFDLRECVEDCLGAFRVQAEREGKALAVDMDPGRSPVVGDASRIQQILSNLLSNAFKFTPSGGRISLSIRRLVGGEPRSTSFVVSDTGIGMSKEFLGRIFEPYAREMRFGRPQRRRPPASACPSPATWSPRWEGEIKVESEPGRAAPLPSPCPWRRPGNSKSPRLPPDDVRADFSPLRPQSAAGGGQRDKHGDNHRAALRPRPR